MDAIQAAFADARSVKTRGAYQLILEIPIEQADAALKLLGGVPQPGKERWVAIAPLKGEEDAGVHSSDTNGDSGASDHDGLQTSADRRSARRELTEGERLRTRAVLLCRDERFQEWVWERMNYGQKSEAAARSCVLDHCGIDSRSELALSIPAQAKFRELERQFREETGQAAERRS